MLGECLAVWTSKTVVFTPAVALVLHQKDQAAASVSEVAEAGFWVFVFTAPPGKQVTAEC